VLNRLLELAWDEVEESRTKNDGKHLLAGTDDIPQPPTAECPSKERMEKQYPFPCPCVDSGPTSNLKPVYGPILILSPAGLLETWQQEFNDSIDESDSRVGMTLFVAHQSGKSRQIITPEQINSLRCDNSDGEFLPKGDQTRYIVLTTSRSIDTHVQSKLRREIRHPAVTDNRGRKGKPYITYEEGVWWGMILRDEAHQEKASTSSAMTQIRRIRKFQDNQLPVWFYSGTVFEVSPNDLHGIFEILEDDSWSTHPILKNCTSKKVIELGKTFKKADISADARADLVKGTSLLLRTAMIARTTETKWWGGPIMELKPHKDIYIECPISRDWAAQLNNMDVAIRQGMVEEHRKHVKKWAEGGKQGPKPTISNEGYVRKHFKTRICATFPALIELIKTYKLRLTWDELFEDEEGNRRDWLNDPKCPYRVHLDDIIESSTKIKELEKIVNSLGKDWQGNDEKLIIMSFSPIVAIIVHEVSCAMYFSKTVDTDLSQWLERKGKNVALFHAKLTFKQRKQLEDGFEERRDEHGELVSPLQPQILVGTTGVLGTGLNLPRAFRMVITEPDYLNRVEKQAKARIRRASQKNPRTTAYLLCDTTLKIEKAIYDRRRGRALFQENVLDYKVDDSISGIVEG
jgi:SNF2 family DNA or RNA helicase